MPGISAPILTWSPRSDVAVGSANSVNADGPEELDSDRHRSATAALAEALTADAAIDEGIAPGAARSEAAGEATGPVEGKPGDGGAPEPYRSSDDPESDYWFVDPLRRPARGV
jgi:hypothetical protein